MSTKGTIYLDDDCQIHLFHDIFDNRIHLAVIGQGEVTLSAEEWRDLVAEVAATTLRMAEPTRLGGHLP